MKVAWVGHKAKERGDGLIIYSREIVKGLEARGAEVIFFYHGDKDIGGPVAFASVPLTSSTTQRVSEQKPRRKRGRGWISILSFH